VEIPQAERVVRRFRERLDPSARLGVPAHITVLYPFIPPAGLDAAVLGQLERLFAAVDAGTNSGSLRTAVCEGNPNR